MFIKVDKLNKIDLRIFLREGLDGFAHMHKSIAKVHGAVTSKEHMFFAAAQVYRIVSCWFELFLQLTDLLKFDIDLVYHQVERIDHGVADDGDGSLF